MPGDTDLDFPGLPRPEELTAGAHAGAPADPDADGRTDAPTSLSALRAELTSELAPEVKTWPNPSRPGYGASFRLDLTEPDLEQARKFATRKKGRAGRDDEVSEVTQLLQLLARYNTAITKDGTDLVDEDSGHPATFRTPGFQSIYGASRAIDAVRGFYGTDGAIISVGRAFVRATGWMDDPDEVDLEAGPTRR